MQWLNKVDDALDRVFLRSAGGADTTESGGDDGVNSHGKCENQSSVNSVRVTGMDRDHDVIHSVGGVTRDVDTCAPSSRTGIDSRMGNIVPRPPPPPPPPPRSKSIPPPPKRSISSISFPSTPIAPAAAGEFLIDDGALIASDDNPTEGVSLDFEGGSTSEERLRNLANVMQQLERDAMESGPDDNYQFHGRYEINESEGGESVSRASDNQRMQTIPLLPLSSQITRDTESQSQDINPQYHGTTNSQNQKSTKSNVIVHLPASSCHKPPPPPPPLQPAQSSHRVPLASNLNNHQWAPSTPRLPLHIQHPIPTPRITPSRNTPRPTPGIIRRKIRSPSVSPPNSSTSPLPSFDEIDDRNNGATMLPPPPFIDGDNTIESLSKAAITAAATASGMQQSPELMTPIPTVNAVTRNIMVHRSPRKVNPFSDESTEESNILEKKDQVTNIDPAKNTLRAWTGDDESEKAKDEHISKNERIADDDSSSTSFHSHISNRSDLTDDDNEDDDRTEQEVLDFALPENILESPSSKSWDPAYNCYGVVHVRVLRAQRLPCTVGTFVVANLALPPWKGRVRIPGRATIDGPDRAGVCLRWDKPFSKREKDRGSVDGMTDDPCSHSMVHAYNNQDTPIPIVSLTLLSSTMGGVFEKFLCSVSFSCRDIMKSPGIWSSKWCNATIDPVLGSASTSSSQKQSLLHGVIRESTIEEAENDENNPLILLEACFEPKVQESEQMISEDSDTLGPIPRDLVIRSSPETRLRAMPENVYSSMEDDSVSKTSTLTSALVRHQSPKSHLLRVRSFWSPAWCSVCSKIITSGWVQSSFECEACHIFCCKDCQLQVDVCIPCGSELSKIAVKKAQQYQVSIGQVMTTLAPYSGRGTSGEHNLSNVQGKVPTTVSKIEGIGVLRIRVLNACLFGKTYPPDAEPTDIFAVDSTNLRNGDHYVRISWLGSKDSKRTKTVLQAAKPVFDSDEMTFDVAHYGMEYKLEVVDANTDKAVGSCLLSAQGLLQWQRDDLLAHWDQFFFTLLQRRRQAEPRKMKLELRTAVKDGFGLNFYNSTKIADDSKEKSSSFVPGEISGWVEIDVDFEEDTQGLFYSRDPRPCPPRATEEFDIAMIQLHIARIAAIAEDIQKLVTAYLYLVSWENPVLTGSSLIVFVALTLGYNLEYLGALPIGILVMYMVYLGQIRITGKFKERWIKKEKDALVESESTIEKHYTIHRPVGLLHVADLRGRNLRSRDLGLPGSFYVSISFDPLRYANEKEKKSLSRLDAASSCTHHVGTTISPGITSSPIWSRIRESAELSRLKHLLPDDRLWSEDLGTDSEGLVKYPILQPITKDRSLYLDENEDDRRSMDIGLLPWESSLGALVLQVRFSEVLGSFQLFENVLGEVVLPLAKLAGGQEVEGWFRLLGAGTTDTVPGTSDDDPIAETKPRGLSEDGESIPDEHDTDVPELHAKVKFLTHSIQPSSDTETSRVICEEMARTASVSREGSIGMIGSSISTINTVRTLGGTLQNQLSYTVNIIEMIRNAFNFSSPRITCFLLFCLTILWIVLAFVPTRIVVLLAGLGQFGATYYTKFMFVSKTTNDDKPDDEELASRGNIIENLFLSIPTDEDLRRTYFWEAKRAGEREREKIANAKRRTRLEKLWKATWYGNVRVKEKRTDASSSQSKRTWSWETAFVLIEGHRFIWWRSEKHFDTGEAPLGQIFFAGHSGLAGLSPLDLRELSREEIPFVVSVFGRGAKTQQKVTLLAPSPKVKDELENAVLTASNDRKTD